VAAACAALQTPLIHMSTDALFDGDHAPYRESDDPSPVNAYGRAKALAEGAVKDACPDAAIVRASLIIAPDGSDGTSSWALARLRAGERVTFFDDEFRMPILVEDLAAMLWEIGALDPAERRGVWHLPGAERLSRFDLGKILCRRFGLDESLIDAASVASMPEPRPRDVSLVSDRASSLTVRPRPVASLGRHGETLR
jgi:dTDP-4-dehydrorhamnose reductase